MLGTVRYVIHTTPKEVAASEKTHVLLTLSLIVTCSAECRAACSSKCIHPMIIIPLRCNHGIRLVINTPCINHKWISPVRTLTNNGE